MSETAGVVGRGIPKAHIGGQRLRTRCTLLASTVHPSRRLGEPAGESSELHISSVVGDCTQGLHRTDMVASMHAERDAGEYSDQDICEYGAIINVPSRVLHGLSLIGPHRAYGALM